MKYFFIIVTILLFTAVPYAVFASSIVINEIAWMGSLPQDGQTSSAAANNEWIELKNISATSVTIDGWSLIAEDGTPYVALTGTISAGGFFLMERTNDDTVPGITADVIYTGALSNAGEKLILKDEQGIIIDTVDAASGWPAGSSEKKETMQRAEEWITAPATPRAENSTSGSSSLMPSATPIPTTPSLPNIQPSSTPLPTATPHALPIKTIKAYAGEDRSSAVGVMLDFLGRAKGFNDETINSSARFFWNFGDGETKEGRSIVHIYRMPGSYIAGLHVSSGEEAASDYIRVSINPNLVRIAHVIAGREGYVRLANPSDNEVDVSGWIIRDAGGIPNAGGHQFVLPPHTILGKHGDAAMMNSVTGLLANASSSLPLTVFYPNGVAAFSYSGTEHVAVLRPPIVPLMPESEQKKERPAPSPSIVPVSSIDPSALSEPTVEPTVGMNNENSREYAVAIPPSLPPWGFPFGAAVGISILAAAGFLISRLFS